MIKTTIELHRSKHIQGYGHIGGPSYATGSPSTMDALVRWSALPENAGKNIVSHNVRIAGEQRNGPLEFHYASEAGWSQERCAELFKQRVESQRKAREFESINVLTESASMVYRMPLIDEVFYLDIYYQ